MLEEVRKHIEELIARYEAEKVENARLREVIRSINKRRERFPLRTVQTWL